MKPRFYVELLGKNSVWLCVEVEGNHRKIAPIRQDEISTNTLLAVELAFELGSRMTLEAIKKNLSSDYQMRAEGAIGGWLPQ